MSKTASATHVQWNHQGAWYMLEEHTLIDLYKVQYLQATSSQECKRIAQHLILPKMYNHWQDMGIWIEDAPARTEAQCTVTHYSLDTEVDKVDPQQLSCYQGCWPAGSTSCHQKNRCFVETEESRGDGRN